MNQTYRVFFDMPDKSIKSYIVQKVSTFAFAENYKFLCETVKTNKAVLGLARNCLIVYRKYNEPPALYTESRGINVFAWD